MTGFLVMSKRCSTCIYRKDSHFDLKKHEDEVRDPHMGFKGHRICHHSSKSKPACCNGFWTEHKDEFAAGQLAQRLNLVEFIEPGKSA